MPCPECRCKVTYPYYVDDEDAATCYERCAHCGHIFDIDMGLDDDDEQFDNGATALSTAQPEDI